MLKQIRRTSGRSLRFRLAFPQPYLIPQVSPCVSATLPDSLALVQTLNITEREIKARTKAQAVHSSTAHLSERQH